MGSAGVQGFQGNQGSDGRQGQIGNQGATGSAGVQGSQGSQGNGGVQGQRGNQGNAGAQGVQGYQGYQGYQGPCCPGPQGSQGFQGVQGYQGQTGPSQLLVELTAFVDNAFASATPALQDAARPYATINAALAAIDAWRVTNDPTAAIRWRVTVRPGTYVADALIVTRRNVSIIGSGPATQVTTQFDTPIGGGPAWIADMVVTFLPTTAPYTVQDTLTISDTEWYFTPSTSAAGAAFLLTGDDGPSLTMNDSFLSVKATSPTTIGTGFWQITNMTSPVARLEVFDVTGEQHGIAAGVVGFDSISGLIDIEIRDSHFDFTMEDAGAGSIQFIYGGLGIIGRGNGVADLQWHITNCEHTIRNGAVLNPLSETVLAVLSGFGGFDVGQDSHFILRDCLFDFVGWPPSYTSIYSAYDISSAAGNFIQLFDDKWRGLTLAGAPGGPYVPQRRPGSLPISYDAVGADGSNIFSGGLQTGATAVPAASTSYAVGQGDGVVAWLAPGNAGPLALALPTSQNDNFVGKWVGVYNQSAASASPTNNVLVSGGGLAPSQLVVPQGGAIFQTFDGSNWFVAGANPRASQVATASTTQAVGTGATVTATASAAAAGLPSTTVTGGGWVVTPASAAQQLAVVASGPVDGSLAPPAAGVAPTQWTVQLVNTGAPLPTVTLTVHAVLV
jgi:hypothetical protein